MKNGQRRANDTDLPLDDCKTSHDNRYRVINIGHSSDYESRIYIHICISTESRSSRAHDRISPKADVVERYSLCNDRRVNLPSLSLSLKIETIYLHSQKGKPRNTIDIILKGEYTCVESKYN